MGHRRLLAYYLALGLLTAAGAAMAIAIGSGRDATPGFAGTYEVEGGTDCLGGQLVVRQSGEFAGVRGAGDNTGGNLRLRDGRLTGTVNCVGGTTAELAAQVGEGALEGTLGDESFTARLSEEPAEAGTQQARAPGGLEGEYALTPRSACLGGDIEIHGPAARPELEGNSGAVGELVYRDGSLTGEVRCADGQPAEVSGVAKGREITLEIEGGAGSETVVADHRREFGHTLAAFFIAVALVMIAARLAGMVAVRVGQPRVMGEVAAGILLGPTALGALLPDVQAALFPSDIIPYIGVAANLGLIFYMFLVGLEIDLSQLQGRFAQTALISNTGVAVPMLAGLAVAVPIYGLLGTEQGFLGFALFMGVSMSITAFPVLARILAERRMLQRPVGAIALASAAIDDVTAWFLIALATAVAVAGSPIAVVRTIALAIAFCLLMWLVVRRLLARASVAYDEAGRVPVSWITTIFAGVLLSAWATEEIGIALIFGAFVMGAVMPRHAGLTEDITHRVEDFVVLLLLPLFFAYTGLRTDVLLLDRWELVIVTLVLLVVAIACKFGGTMLAARFAGMGWRDSAVVGALMNTRGLTELIVLNLALEKGVISEALFAALVIMALVTTFMTGPLLRLLDPRNELGQPVEEELEAARVEAAAEAPRPVPDRAILVTARNAASLERMAAVAAPLAASEPPREVILVQLVEPPRSAAVRGALQTQQFRLDAASREVAGVRARLVTAGIAARGVALSATETGDDLTRLAATEAVDLVVVDGRRPIIGDGIPRGEVGAVLEHAPCDVAVLVAREGAVVAPGPDAPVLVPFGGAEHDWAALELGAWLSSATGAPLRLVGAVRPDEEGDPARLLASASLLVQRFVGVAADPIITEPGREGIVSAAEGAGLLIVGLSERWRSEGLGSTRADIARAAPAPILFVRRGLRAGALAPRDDVTRFTWSAPAAAR